MTTAGQSFKYIDNVGTPTTEDTTTKVLTNSILSTKDEKCMIFEMNDMYLQTLLNFFEYMKIPYNIVPDKIKQQYNLKALGHNGWIYVQI